MTTENNENKTPEQITAEAAEAEKKRIDELVAKGIEDSLKDVKEKLNAAFAQRDEANKKLAERELADEEARRKKLEEEGKHKEVYELKLADERAKREALEKRNIELSRDVEVRTALAGKDFRNERSINMAFKEIVSELVKDDNGNWKHQSGVSIQAYVEKFSSDEDNAFLFKVKANNGSGTSTQTGGTNTEGSKPKSLFSMSQAEVLKMAEEGKLQR